jgi:transcriptional regulator with XRE-family HTH domain
MRNATGMSQAKVAKFFGIAPSSVAQWEGGRSKPDIERLPDLAELYRVSLTDLCGSDFPIAAVLAAAARSRSNSNSRKAELPGDVSEEEERELLRIWRRLPREVRNAALVLISAAISEPGKVG